MAWWRSAGRGACRQHRHWTQRQRSAPGQTKNSRHPGMPHGRPERCHMAPGRAGPLIAAGTSGHERGRPPAARRRRLMAWTMLKIIHEGPVSARCALYGCYCDRNAFNKSMCTVKSGLTGTASSSCSHWSLTWPYHDDRSLAANGGKFRSTKFN